MKNLTFILFTFLIILSCSHQKYSVNLVEQPQVEFTPAQLLKKPRLIYPVDAQLSFRSGQVVLDFLVFKNGDIDSVEIVRSTGSKSLDQAAADYVKGLEYEPAVRNGKHVISKLRWEIDYDLSTSNRFAEKYVREVKQLYQKASESSGEERRGHLLDIQNAHEDFTHFMTDYVNVNKFIRRVIANDIHEAWGDVWHLYPLRFLLFHDFIQRYPNYEKIDSVKVMLMKTIKEDIDFIKTTIIPATKQTPKQNREEILTKIDGFLREEYPDIELR